MRVDLEDGSKLNVVFMATATEPALSPKEDYDTKKQKSTEDGKLIWNGRNLLALRMVNGVPNGVEQNVSVNLLSQPAGGIFALRHYKLSGKTTITHYLTDGNRMGVSITAEGITPTKETSNTGIAGVVAAANAAKQNGSSE